jgi:hypothetical protein
VFAGAFGAALPLLFILLAYGLRPGPTAVGVHRLTAVRASLAVGAFGVLTIEGLSATRAMRAGPVAVAWLTALAAAAALATWRWRRDRAAGGSVPRPIQRWRAGWAALGRVERWLAGTVVAIVLAELLVGWLSAPNNFDSQTYHLPRIERWVAQGTVDAFPTAIHRQVTFPPGAEYLLVHLRLLVGDDRVYPGLQWATGILCLIAASRIAAQLGGGARAQWLTAFLIAVTPIVTLEASSTQTDLVVAAWVASGVTVALDGVIARAGVGGRVGQALGLGAATGLTAVTKTSGLFGLAPFLVVWGLAQLRPVRPARVAAAAGLTVIVLTVAALLTGPFLARMAAEFGNPLGPPAVRDAVPMQRHDPAAVLVNALRIGHTALDTPFAPLRDASASAIRAIARLVGVDPQDRDITFGRTTFPVRAWYPDEDRVAFPLQAALILVVGGIGLVRPRWVGDGGPSGGHRLLRVYAAAGGVAVVLHAAGLKWQPWGNRLLIYLLVLGAPLAGLWLDSVLRSVADHSGHSAGARRDRHRRLIVGGTAGVLALAAVAGILAISYGFPRRLVGAGSVFTTSDWESRFLRRPAWAPEYRWAADEVHAVGAHRIGLVERNDDWEYPWWLLLAGDEIVPLQSVLPKHPAADPGSVEAIVCTGDRATCERLTPAGWRLEFRTYVGVALPPPA